MGLFSWIGDLFGGDDEPKQEVPAAPVYKSAEQLWQEAMNWGKTNFPQAYGARESALADVQNPNYYASWQPTSFENALANQNFDIAKRGINQGLSLSGMEYSPILAKSYGDVGATIGEYLSNLGQQRAAYSLASRLGIDPINLISPFLNTDTSQSNTQTASDYQNALLRSQVDYQNALKDYANNASGISGLFGLGGALIGSLVPGADIGTALLGSSIGNMASPLFGGSGTGGIDLGDALSAYSYFNPNKTMTSKVKGASTTSLSDLGAIMGYSGAYPSVNTGYDTGTSNYSNSRSMSDALGYPAYIYKMY